LSYVVFSAFPPTKQGEDTTSWKSWQVLFMIEGCLTVIIALVGFAWLPHGPGSAWFLSAAEREVAESRVVQDRTSQDSTQNKGQEEEDSYDEGEDTGETRDDGNEQAEGLLGSHHGLLPNAHAGKRLDESNLAHDKGLSTLDITEALSDWKVWYLLFFNICSSVPSMAFSVFLPLVVKGLGFDSVTANLLTAPPFIAGAICLWVFSWWSDKRQERMIPIICGLCINLLGLTGVVMLPTTAYLLRYLSLCVLLAGSFVASPLTVAWLSGNMVEPGKRAVVLGLNGWGNLAGVVSSLLFSSRYAPHYTTPFYVTFCLVLLSLLGYAGFGLLLIRENRNRAVMTAHWTEEDVQKERLWGRGPKGQTSQWLPHMPHLLVERIGQLGIVERLGRLGTAATIQEREGRRGDERMTYQYGL
jgi:Major Facilitator Superfamily